MLKPLSPSPSAGLSLVPDAPVVVPHDHRRGISKLELGSILLAHAVNYLVSEQLAGRRPDVAANRQAIAILCTAGRELEQAERRRPAKKATANWLRGAALFRATRAHPPSDEL